MHGTFPRIVDITADAKALAMRERRSGNDTQIGFALADIRRAQNDIKVALGRLTSAIRENGGPTHDQTADIARTGDRQQGQSDQLGDICEAAGWGVKPVHLRAVF